LTSQWRTHRGLKLISCICFLLIAAAMLLVDRHSPAAGYELSIYDSMGPSVWMCLIGAIAGGTGIIVHQAFAETKSRLWLLGFLSLTLATAIILLLPAFRDYYLYSAEDTNTHVQLAEGILLTRHFGQDNKYPITHTLIAQLSHICGVAPVHLVRYVPVLFSVLFMLFSYLLATSVLPHRGQAVLAAGTTTLFFNYYHVCAYPQTMAMMTLPLVFYLYFKGFLGMSLPFRVAFVVVLLLLPFFHPAPAAVLIACLLAAEGAKLVWRMREPRADSPVTAKHYGVTYGPTLICGVTFLAWISSFYIFTKTVYNILNWLVGEIESVPRVAEVEQMFQSRGLDVQAQVLLGLKLYGDNVVYLGLSALALLIVFGRFLQRDTRVRNLSILSMPFLVSGPAWVLIFATTLLVTLGRLLSANIMMWATPPLAAFTLYEVLGRWRRSRVFLITASLLVASVLGVLSVYHSPYVLQPSWQVTHRDVDGAEWFLDHTAYASRDRFATLGIPRIAADGLVVMPQHFGYSTNDRLGQSLPIDLHVLIGERFRLSAADPTLSKAAISDQRLASPGFETTDLHRLNVDRSVQKLYSNGELDVFLVWTEG
jgi:hypothetical protein